MAGVGFDAAGRPLKTFPLGSGKSTESVAAVTLVDPFGNPVDPGGGGSTSSTFTKRIDQVGDVIYIGETIPGTHTSDAFWRIKRVTTVGDDITIEWASGGQMTAVWDDRLTVVYT